MDQIAGFVVSLIGVILCALWAFHNTKRMVKPDCLPSTHNPVLKRSIIRPFRTISMVRRRR